ncbi:MAG: hypothetical protein ACP5PN_09725 [Steroidobacteraceae bacterium]
MNTPTSGEPCASESAEVQAPADPPSELVELGTISATEGGILGLKYDTGVGWQYY